MEPTIRYSNEVIVIRDRWGNEHIVANDALKFADRIAENVNNLSEDPWKFEPVGTRTFWYYTSDAPAVIEVIHAD